MVSYADFVTLLFAFFVVMFATANADKGKAQAMSDAVKAALSEPEKVNGAEAVRSTISDKLEELRHTSEAEKAAYKELQPSMAMLKKQLGDEIRKGEVEMHLDARGLTISFRQAALFDSGAAVVRPSAFGALSKVASAIKSIHNQVRLEGHTDNLPIHTDRFANNWELSSARSIAILQILSAKLAVPTRRLAVSGYADVAPVASNDTEVGRAKNRRVDMVLLSSMSASTEMKRDSVRAIDME